jgi:hypothetical protein
MNDMELDNERKEMIRSLVECVKSGGGDGCGCIVCKYPSLKDVGEFIGDIYVRREQEAINVISLETFIENHKYWVKLADEALIII